MESQNFNLSQIKNKKQHKKLSFLAVLLTLGIIVLLLSSGPAYALNLNISPDRTSANIGEYISYDLTVNLDSSQYQNLSSITLILDGPLKKVCEFDKNGAIINGCSGVSSIYLISKTNGSYGYGYGYGYGYSSGSFTEVKYRVIIDTLSYVPGSYASQIKVLIGNDVYTKNGVPIALNYNNGGNNNTNGSENNQTNSTNSTEIKRSDYSSNSKPTVNNFGSEGQLSKVYLSKSDKFNFHVGYEEHTLEVIEVNNEGVTLIIRSEPKKVVMTITKDEEVDLDGDGKTDLKLSLLYAGDNEASLMVKYPQTLVLTKNETIKAKSGVVQNLNMFSSVKNYEEENIVYGLAFGNGLLGNVIFVVLLIFVNLIMIELIAFATISIKRKRNRAKIRRYKPYKIKSNL